MKKISVMPFGMAMMLSLSLGALGFYGLAAWSEQALNVKEEKIIKLAPGEGRQGLAENLAREGLISDKRLFSLWVRLLRRDFHKVQAGTYLFTGAVSPRHIMAKLVAGEIYRPIVLEFTIPEGFTLAQINARLEKLQVASAAELHSLAQTHEFLAAYRLTAPSLEGFLYPATYRFYERLPSARDIYETMVAEFFKRLPGNYLNLCEQHRLSLYEAVIFASLIEKETSIEAEKPMIAEVIWNRLRNNIPLGIDAAIIYGIDDYKGNLSGSHLRDRSNAYNTRVHRGLPPSPIGAPSRSSLEAVYQPSQKGYYYYVLLADGVGGQHHFSKTLQEHNKYVKKLVRAQHLGKH